MPSQFTTLTTVEGLEAAIGFLVAAACLLSQVFPTRQVAAFMAQYPLARAASICDILTGLVFLAMGSYMTYVDVVGTSRYPDVYAAPLPALDTEVLLAGLAFVAVGFAMTIVRLMRRVRQRRATTPAVQSPAPPGSAPVAL